MENILSRLERYIPPPFQPSEYFKMEVFDYREKGGEPNPKTKLDAFIFDIMTNADNYGITKGAWYVLKLYQAVPENKLGGYRIWTHWNFVNSITDHMELWELGKEIDALLRSGRNWEKEKYDLIGIPEEHREYSSTTSISVLPDRLSII